MSAHDPTLRGCECPCEQCVMVTAVIDRTAAILDEAGIDPKLGSYALLLMGFRSIQGMGISREKAIELASFVIVNVYNQEGYDGKGN